MKDILNAHVVMDDDGKYQATIIDYLGDQTFTAEVPDHLLSMIPIGFEQLRRRVQ